MSAVRVNAKIIRQEPIASDIYSMEISVPVIADQAKPGQFVTLYSKDGARLMPRPISICEINVAAGTLHLVYRVVGAGTREFAALQSGDWITVMGPLGNGFTIRDKKAILIGGGIGIPPMLALTAGLACEKTVVLGFRDEIFLAEAFEPYGDVYIASEDGGHGVKGNVLDAVREYGVTGEVIYACGPMPMLRAVKAYAMEHGIEAQLSLEERMACGVGACLGCVCETKDRDAHSNVHNKRICKDGPVFFAEEVELS
ncbi:MAG: dihydroorotate dehydrogenase electron transfer subunit [Lachnospiraceae bacterium]|nr:dihydroorotate dehydrogenase electron transfer subunit [Lachnospiraceae bacterium]